MDEILYKEIGSYEVIDFFNNHRQIDVISKDFEEIKKIYPSNMCELKIKNTLGYLYNNPLKKEKVSISIGEIGYIYKFEDEWWVLMVFYNKIYRYFVIDSLDGFEEIFN